MKEHPPETVLHNVRYPAFRVLDRTDAQTATETQTQTQTVTDAQTEAQTRTTDREASAAREPAPGELGEDLRLQRQHRVVEDRGLGVQRHRAAVGRGPDED